MNQNTATPVALACPAPGPSSRAVELVVGVTLDAHALRATIVDTRSDVRETFGELTPGQR